MSSGMDEFNRITRMIGADRAEKLAMSLGRGKKIKEALRSELGQIFLDELVDTIQRETRNLADGKYDQHSPDETDCRAEIRVAKRILDRWAKKLSDHQAQLDRWDKLATPRG